ncbi:MAG: hypothetical protein ACK4X1_00350 [Terricaulis sp.]
MSNSQATRAQAGVRSTSKLGMYQIVSGPKDGAFRAHAFVGAKAIGAVSAESEELAIENITAHLKQRIGAFELERVEGLPERDEYREALNAVEMESGAALVSALEEHLRRPEGVCVEILAQRVRLPTPIVWDSYLKLSRRLASLTGARPKPKEGVGKAITPILLIADIAPAENNDSALITLREAFAVAMAERLKGLR